MAPLQTVCHSGEEQRGSQDHAGAQIGALVIVSRMGVGRESCSEECRHSWGLCEGLAYHL